MKLVPLELDRSVYRLDLLRVTGGLYCLLNDEVFGLYIVGEGRCFDIAGADFDPCIFGGDGRVGCTTLGTDVGLATLGGGVLSLDGGDGVCTIGGGGDGCSEDILSYDGCVAGRTFCG